MITFNLPSEQTITRQQLDNGIIVLVYPMQHVRSVAISGVLPAGSIYESPAQNGLASLTADALNRGTLTRDFDTLHGALEDAGASLSAGGGRHSAAFNARSLAEDLPLVMTLLADVLRNPAFPEDLIEQLRAQRLTGLNYSQQDIRYRAASALREALYPAGHPYYYSSFGSLQTVPQLTADDMRDFHRKHYGPTGMMISVAGAVTPDDVLQVVQNEFGDWENTSQPTQLTVPDVSPPEDPVRENVQIAGKTQSAIVMGAIGPRATDDDYLAARLANSILGEFGMMGRVGNRIREREGLAYYASSRLERTLGPSAWTITAGVAPEDVDRAISLALEEVQRITDEPVSDEDLSDNRSYFIGRLPLTLEAPQSISAQILLMERYGLGLDYLVNYAETLTQLTTGDLLQAAKRYLKPDQMVISVAGPR